MERQRAGPKWTKLFKKKNIIYWQIKNVQVHWLTVKCKIYYLNNL